MQTGRRFWGYFRIAGDPPALMSPVTGHDFSRAARTIKNRRALAPAGSNFGIGGHSGLMIENLQSPIAWPSPKEA
jgi:hypothetical protein